MEVQVAVAEERPHPVTTLAAMVFQVRETRAALATHWVLAVEAVEAAVAP
jgi:hypothetical protein